MQIVKDTTSDCVKSATDDLKQKHGELISQYENHANLVRKQSEEYHAEQTKMQKIAKEWSDKFSSKVVSASIFALISALILVLGIFITMEIINPIWELNEATKTIETVQENCEIVNHQMNTYYKNATGHSLQYATIEWLWQKEDYVGAVFFWIGAYWKDVLLVIFVGNWVIRYFTKDNDRR